MSLGALLVIQASDSLALRPAVLAVVLISCFPSNARRHALCMATKSLTLLLLITEKLRVTGPACAAGDVCGASTPGATFGQMMRCEVQVLSSIPTSAPELLVTQSLDFTGNLQALRLASNHLHNFFSVLQSFGQGMRFGCCFL